jgi:7-carboxy-7-deazaguanine synthase
MLQYKSLAPLLARLEEQDKFVSIETNGSKDTNPWVYSCSFNYVWDWPSIRWIVDYKLPSSGMEEFMIPAIFNALREIDVIKFVIADKRDYQRALEIRRLFSSWKAKKVFSPAIVDQKDYTGWPACLAEMMIRDKLYDVRYSLQVHKCLWPNAKQER